MGEAKRRKQKLGKDYGKVPPVLTMGSQQFEKHLDQFMKSWYGQMETLYGDLDNDEDKDQEKQLSPEESQALQQQLATWLTDYFESYRIPDRQKLIAGILDPQYAQLQRFVRAGQQPTQSDMEAMQKWMFETLNLYGMFKPHLSKAQLKTYGGPLKSFYELAMQEAEAENNEEQIEDLKTVFAPCLDS